MNRGECERCADLVGPVAFWGNLGLSLIKGVVGYFSGSKAIMADAVHSGTDVILGLFVYISLKISGKPASEKHQFGHGKIEFIATAIIGVLLFFLCIIMVVYSILAIVNGDLVEPGSMAVWVAIISILGNEVMAQHHFCAGKQMNSSTMTATGFENRADAYSSLAALVGVLGAKLGFLWLDPLAVIIVGALILRSSYRIMMDAYNGLLDRDGVDEMTKTTIIEILTNQEGILNVDYLWGRRAGQKNIIYVGVRVDHKTTIAEGKMIKENILVEIHKLVRNIGFINLKLVAQE